MKQTVFLGDDLENALLVEEVGVDYRMDGWIHEFLPAEMRELDEVPEIVCTASWNESRTMSEAKAATQ